ncbi:unnamed protein product [Strongylus vulgaris]|uniref:Uncharacterized protein n=1 Tax=Strongylus vulgaris TaxID=40348 RepID=A0A3P7IZI2_STRVU|nr:unnamed protein product [Strongylus vulgaris]
MTQMVIDPHVFDATVRDYLNVTAPRTMAVLEGLKMTIENFNEMNLPSKVTVPDFPSDPQCNKTHEVAFDRTVYIERSDYRQVSYEVSFFCIFLNAAYGNDDGCFISGSLGLISDWDDPRLFTLTALRRRGIPPEAINAFVAKLGLTMTQMVIDPHVFDATVRDYLNVTAPRTMAVLEGLKMTIENFDEMNLPSKVTVPDFPSDPQCNKTHEVAFDRTVYIERSDYRQVSYKISFFCIFFNATYGNDDGCFIFGSSGGAYRFERV